MEAILFVSSPPLSFDMVTSGWAQTETKRARGWENERQKDDRGRNIEGERGRKREWGLKTSFILRMIKQTADSFWLIHLTKNIKEYGDKKGLSMLEVYMYLSAYKLCAAVFNQSNLIKLSPSHRPTVCSSKNDKSLIRWSNVVWCVCHVLVSVSSHQQDFTLTSSLFILEGS